MDHDSQSIPAIPSLSAGYSDPAAASPAARVPAAAVPAAAVPTAAVLAAAGLAAAACVLSLAACGGRLATREGQFEVREQKVTMAKRDFTATYVRPATPRHPDRLVVFSTGDAGWLGLSGVVFARLAELGYYAAGYNAREMLKPIKESGERVGLSRGAEWLDGLFLQARKDLGLPETTPLIL